MLSIVNSMTIAGINGYKIEIQVDVSNGMPSWDIVGLPDTSIRESKERVRTAIKNTGYNLPSKKIIINLAPANIKKEGAIFDLGIAIAVLKNIGIVEKETLEDKVFLGELSLDGTINPIIGVLPMCIESKRIGIKKIILPKQNAKEAAIVAGIEVIGAENLSEVVKYLNNEIEIKPEEVDIEKLFKSNYEENIDFSEVKGQENVKRALEIAAAGGHNCLLIGSPGSRENYACKKNNNNTSRFEF